MKWVRYSDLVWDLSSLVAYVYTELPSLSFIPRHRATIRGRPIKAASAFPAAPLSNWFPPGENMPLASGFAATADATVSFDGQRVIFAAKLKATDPWQIWEMPVAGGAARCIVCGQADAITPFYLPGDRIVYSLRTPTGFQLVTVALDGGAPLQLTYGAGNRVAADVLRDGRVLFEWDARSLHGVFRRQRCGELPLRSRSGPPRREAGFLRRHRVRKRRAAGPLHFGARRATPADAAEGRVCRAPWPNSRPQPGSLSYRPDSSVPHGLYLWGLDQTLPQKFFASALEAVQPVLVQPRPVPKRHPSALGDREGANLLCLNVYTSKLKIATGQRSPGCASGRCPMAGSPVVLGEAPVEKDGSFFVNPPSETAIRFELLDRSGKIAAAEKNWFWARRGEQRVCVGCHAGSGASAGKCGPRSSASQHRPRQADGTSRYKMKLSGVIPALLSLSMAVGAAADPLRGSRRAGGNLLHPQFRRGETGVAAGEHGRRRRLVRL